MDDDPASRLRSSESAAEDLARKRPKARLHHRRFKQALVDRALADPAAFLATCTTNERLKSLFAEVGAAEPEAERVPDAGLAVSVVGEPDRPVVMITMPAPERPNEAYYLLMLPALSTIVEGALHAPPPFASGAPPRLRVFGMERSILPDGGVIGFVVEWTGTRRRNYDAPDNPSLRAFWRAVLEICDGKRAALHSTTMGSAPPDFASIASAIAELERATWFASVGRPPVPGWPPRYENVRWLTSWEDATALAMTAASAAQITAPLLALKTALGTDYDAFIGRLSAMAHALLNRKFRPCLATPETNRTLASYATGITPPRRRCSR